MSVNYALAKWIAASTLREKGDYNKADQYLKDAYQNILNNFGENSVPLSGILNSQAMLYMKQDKNEEALEKFK